MKLTISMSLHKQLQYTVTLKVKICSVRAPLLPIWSRHLNLIQSAVLLRGVIWPNPQCQLIGKT